MTRRVAISGALWKPGDDEADVWDDIECQWVRKPVITCPDCGLLGVDSPCSECRRPTEGQHQTNCAHCARHFLTDDLRERYCSLGCADLRARTMEATITSLTHGRTEGWGGDTNLKNQK